MLFVTMLKRQSDSGGDATNDEDCELPEVVLKQEWFASLFSKTFSSCVF